MQARPNDDDIKFRRATSVLLPPKESSGTKQRDIEGKVLINGVKKEYHQDRSKLYKDIISGKAKIDCAEKVFNHMQLKGAHTTQSTTRSKRSSAI